jgi:hypothetical protein
MKARKLNKRNTFLYAEITKSARKDAIGTVVRFAKKECNSAREYISGNIVISGMKDVPASESLLTFSNPYRHNVNWKILPNFITSQ